MNTFFRGPPLLLQSRSTDMHDDDRNTINSHMKCNILDIFQPNANHAIY